jgi:hypothetical protein
LVVVNVTNENQYIDDQIYQGKIAKANIAY